MHDYMNSSPENLIITPNVRSGSARLNVYEVNAACKATYRGTVELDGSKVKVGLPVNRLINLDFNFSDSSFFAGSRSVSYGAYLTPREGYRYDAVASYIDKTYGATIYEQDQHGGVRHEVTHITPKACVLK